MAGIPFPHLEPVLYSFGPISLHWYAPVSLAALILAWVGYMFVQYKSKKLDGKFTEDMSVWLVIGVLLLGAGAYVFLRPLHQMLAGPLSIRWYALAYLAGFVLGWQYCLYLARQNPKGPTPRQFDDFLVWAVLGTVLGGRLGYVVVYQPDYYFSHPLDIFAIWHGGMSFHGGMLGVIVAALVYVKRFQIKFFSFTDILACVVPIGLGFGRLANFVNAELYGRTTAMAWGVVFPCRANMPVEECPGPLPRHPSQLYEAMLEGVLLFTIMFFLARKPEWRARPGLLSGAFLFFYGLFRFTAEFFREPDVQLGFLVGGTTMGQLLSVPMMLFGIYLVMVSDRRAKKRE